MTDVIIHAAGEITERERFELALIKRYPVARTELGKKHATADYINSWVDGAWEGWKLAKADMGEKL